LIYSGSGGSRGYWGPSSSNKQSTSPNLSLRNMDIKPKITLTLNICFNVSHFEMVINPVNNEIGEPRILPTNLKQLVEQLEALLSEVVAKDFETHQCLILG
jgi:hypothetical protein